MVTPEIDYGTYYLMHNQINYQLNNFQRTAELYQIRLFNCEANRVNRLATVQFIASVKPSVVAERNTVYDFSWNNA